jgi:hypothetical protein
MKLTIDVSYYNYLSQVQWDALAKVLDGVIVRLSFGVTRDIMASDHILNARKRGLAVAGYHWVDPTWDFNRQVTVAVGAINDHKVAGWFGDAEQYWSDWEAYMKGDWAKVALSKINPNTLNDFYKKFYTSLASKVSVPVGNYTADWFISSWCPPLATWVYDANYWGASYLRYSNGVDWYNPYAPISTDKIHDIAKLAFIYRGLGRQFESLMPTVTDIPEHLDWNVFTDAGYLKMFGVPGNPDDPIYEDPVETPTRYTVIENVYVREVPNGKIAGYRWKGDVVTSVSSSMGWVQIEGTTATGATAKGWIAGAYLAPTGSMYKVNTFALWIRDVPMGIKISYLLLGAIVQVDKVGAGGWVHIVANNGKPAGWVSMTYLVPA